MKKPLVIAVEVLASFVLMYASGQAPIELPGINLPITLQSMVAILLPLIFNRRNAAGGILLFLILAALGLPLLATGVGGIEYFTSESGGYLLGFYLMAMTTVFLKPLIRKPQFLYVFGIFIIQHIFLTICGLSWIWLLTNSEVHFESHVSPFLPGIIIKSTIGTALYVAIRSIQRIVPTNYQLK